MKVFVALKFKPFGAEEFVGIGKTEKKALDILKREFPYMRGDLQHRGLQSDKDGTYLLDVRAMEVEE